MRTRPVNESSEKNIFQRIIDREIPADIVYETDQVLAFRDIQPQAPVHLLVIPKTPLPSLADVDASHQELLGRLLVAAAELARREGLQQGYRVVINCGRQGGQEVPHLHLHLLGGRDLSWPPG